MPIVGSSLVTSSTAVTKEIFNITLGLANTEQSQLLSSGTIVGYLIKTRGNSDLKITHTATESGTKYISVPGCSVYEDKHLYNNLTIYFQSPQTSDTVEIEVYKV